MQSLTYLQKGNQFEYYTKLPKYEKLAKKNEKKLPKTAKNSGGLQVYSFQEYKYFFIIGINYKTFKTRRPPEIFFFTPSIFLKMYSKNNSLKIVIIFIFFIQQGPASGQGAVARPEMKDKI